MQNFFKKYLEINPPTEPEAYELKIAKKTSIAFDAVSDNQIKRLQEVRTGLYHKIADAPIFSGMKTRFTMPKPFDCEYLVNMQGYVVILFYKLRQPKKTYVIKVEDFIKEKEISERKSLTETRAEEIGKLIILR